MTRESKPYDLIVNKQLKQWPNREISGAEIKTLADSPQDWVVNQIVAGPGEDPEIADSQKVDLDKQAEPKGEKKFTTRKPKTAPGRGQFLPMDDREFFESKRFAYEEIEEKLPDGNVRRLVLLDALRAPSSMFMKNEQGQLMPAGTFRLLIVVPNGYATTRLDSFYTQPRLMRSDGAEPDRANGSIDFLGTDWQFWSRHLSETEWRVGIDGMETYLQYVLNELRIA
jgi:hypothetical protein